MGAKTWMLVYSDEDPRLALAKASKPDRVRSLQLAKKLFPGETLKELPDQSLAETLPRGHEIGVGCYPGVSVIMTEEFVIDRPSTLDRRFIRAGGSGLVTLHAMHSTVDWFAFAHWQNGELVRSLSLSPDDGIIEDIGTRFPFEDRYWAGEFPAYEFDEGDPYPFPFHPLEFGEATLNALFGYQLEGEVISTMFDPFEVTMMQFERSQAEPWWRIGR